jgi:PHD/YefM family antitoxin component YafN of YafNO toxin-antitoxin module
MTKGKGIKAQPEKAGGERNEFIIHENPGTFVHQDNPATSASPSSVKGDLAALKRALLHVLDEHQEAWQQLEKGKALLIEREGQGMAVMMSYQDFEGILDQLEDLEDARDARQVLDAIERGEEEVVPWEKVKAELIAEGILDE